MGKPFGGRLRRTQKSGGEVSGQRFKCLAKNHFEMVKNKLLFLEADGIDVITARIHVGGRGRGQGRSIKASAAISNVFRMLAVYTVR